MTLSRYLKLRGFKTVKEFSELSTIPIRTLNYWYSISDFEMIDYHIKAVKDAQEKR